MLHQLFLFILPCLALSLLPGPDMLLIISRSLSQGRKFGIGAALGAGTGVFIHIFVVSVGLGSLLVKSALAFNIIKFLGACYLLYIGVMSLLNKQNPILTDKKLKDVGTCKKVYWQGFLTNVLNPKVALFFLAFLPQFVVAHSQYSISQQILFLGLLFNSIGTTNNLLIACFFGAAKEWLSTHPKVLNIQQKITGALFIGLALRLTVVE